MIKDAGGFVFFVVLLIGFVKCALLEVQVGPVELVGFESGFVDQGPEFRRLAVDELGAELDNFRAFAVGEDAAADTGAGFEERDRVACFGELSGCAEA